MMAPGAPERSPVDDRCHEASPRPRPSLLALPVAARRACGSAARGTKGRRRAKRPGCRADRGHGCRRSYRPSAALPGRMAMRQKSSSMPARRARRLHEVVIADRRAAERDERRYRRRLRWPIDGGLMAALSSGTMPRSRTSAPAALRARAAMPNVLEAMICAGPGTLPGATSSSPVARIATRGRA